MSIEIDESVAESAMQACSHMAEEQAKMAEECQKAADAGMSNDLVYDYAPVARLFRESAQRWQRCRDTIALALTEED